MDKYSIDKSKQLIKNFNHNKHVWMWRSFILSITFLALSIFVICYKPGELFNKFDCLVLQKVFGAFIKFLNSTDIQIVELFVAVVPLIGTAAIALLNGKKLVIILQFVTMYQYKCIKIFSAISVVSLGQFIYALTMNRTTAATLALVSFAIFHIYVFCYLIRFYNDKAYYRDEVCTYILSHYGKEKTQEINKRNRKKNPPKVLIRVKNFFSKNKDNIIIKKCIRLLKWLKKHEKKSKLEIYLSHYLFPDVPTDHNVIVNDIALVEYLVLNIKFPKDGNDIVFLDSERTNENANENFQQFNCFDDFFNDLFIKLVANMRRTYSKSSDKFLFMFAEQISNIRLDNHYYDFSLHAFIRICLLEYLVEDDNWKNQFESKFIEKMLVWLSNNDRIFPQLYGCEGTNNMTRTEKILLAKINNIYSNYIIELDKESVISYISYYEYELYYMTNKQILICDFYENEATRGGFKYEKYDVVLTYRE